MNVIRLNGSSPAAVHFKLILILTQSEGRKSYTIPELADKCEVAISTMWGWIKILKEYDLVYIKDWIQKGRNGTWVARYALGYKEVSEERPARKTVSEYSDRYRIRQKVKQHTTGAST